MHEPVVFFITPLPLKDLKYRIVVQYNTAIQFQISKSNNTHLFQISKSNNPRVCFKIKNNLFQMSKSNKTYLFHISKSNKTRICFPIQQKSTMSWDSYIDNLIAHSTDAAGKRHADKACIIGLDGGGAWTTAAHANALVLGTDQAANIAKAFKSKDFTPFMSNGVKIGDVKYQFLREEDNKVVYAKKKEHGALTLQSSKTAIVIAHVAEGGQQGNANKAVAAIAEYLEGLGM